jgi:gamma-glutamyl:cysteine ligase YbdK (ATP-grasp superfamily)
MGVGLERERFEAADYERFGERLWRSLEALRLLLKRPGFGEGEPSLGAELELFLIDAAGRPLPLNRAVLRETFDPRLTVELDRFNLECNLRPSPLAGRPFSALRREIVGALSEVRRAARAYGGGVALIGILPTIVSQDLQRGAMTDEPRYRALSAALRQLRRGPFRMDIAGEEPLAITCDDVTFEGANTSLQLHLRVAPGDFARVFNASQLATAPALAVAANSPIFLGHRLWHETRVALFKQAVDERDTGKRRESRVGLGSEWVREGAYEIFARNVERHEVLLPAMGDEDPLECVRAGGVPQLQELRLHQGTVWHWNRAVYDPAAGGHLRVEMRGLPAGPTTPDMIANTAFLIGLTLGLARDAQAWTDGMPFEQVEHNFYRAAQQGLEATLAWTDGPGGAAIELPAGELVRRLLPVARRGLEEWGVEPAECEWALSPVEVRAASGQTGARWQRAALTALEPELGRPRALSAMLQAYLERAARETPVDSWSLPAREGRVRVAIAPEVDAVPESAEEFLRWLGGPVLLRQPGRNRSRTRAVVTLLHGNEPSGVRAVHAWLRSGAVPAVDAVFVIAAVSAALESPGFAHRQLPGARDLNRCFVPPHEGPEGELAREILNLLDSVGPEALVDLHNNTGRSIPYGVGPRAGSEELALVSLFGDRYVHSDLRLGALVEIAAGAFPSVVIECGRAGAEAADAVAREGLARFLGAPRLGSRAAHHVQVMTEPLRVEVLSGLRLGLGEAPAEGVDLTLAAEIDRHNFDRLEPGHRIGWLAPGAPWPLRARGRDGRDVSHELFEVCDGVLRTRREIIPIMITNDPGIALSDCLFYVVRAAAADPA